MIEKPRMGMNSRELYNFLCRLTEEVRKNCLSGDGKTTRVHRSPSGSSVSAIRSGSGAKGGGTGVGLPSGATTDKYLLCTDVVDGLPVYAWVNKVVNTNTWRDPLIIGAGEDTTYPWAATLDLEAGAGQHFAVFAVDQNVFDNNGIDSVMYTHDVTGKQISLHPLSVKIKGIKPKHIHDDIVGEGLRMVGLPNDENRRIIAPFGGFTGYTDPTYGTAVLRLAGGTRFVDGSNIGLYNNGLRMTAHNNPSNPEDMSFGLKLSVDPQLFEFVYMIIDNLNAPALALKGAATATTGQAFGKKEDGTFGFIEVEAEAELPSEGAGVGKVLICSSIDPETQKPIAGWGSFKGDLDI